MTFAELAARYHAPTVQWVAKRARLAGLRATHARERAEECVQEGWAQLLRRGLREGDRYPSLIMNASVRTLWETFRRADVERRNVIQLRPRAVEPGWGAELSPGGRALAELTDSERDAYRLRARGLTYGEIAGEMGLAHAHSAASRVSKANAKVRRAA